MDTILDYKSKHIYLGSNIVDIQDIQYTEQANTSVLLDLQYSNIYVQ